MKPIAFVYNPTSWNSKLNMPIPDGMADRLTKPIIPHLGVHPWEITNEIKKGYVNVLYTYPSVYGVPNRNAGDTLVLDHHGIADKGWHAVPRLAAFNWIFTFGPVWSQKLVDMGVMAELLLETGYAKLDPFFQDRVPRPTRDNGQINVLYAPTHGGGGERNRHSGIDPARPSTTATTWWRQEQVLSLLLEQKHFNVKIAPHPRHRPDGRATFDEYAWADVVIADGGSTIYESWALDLPVVFPDWLTREANINKFRASRDSHERNIYENRIGYHADQPEDLVRLINYAYDNGIQDDAVQFIEGILPRRYRGVSGKMQAECLLDIASNKEPRHKAVTHPFDVVKWGLEE